MTLLQATAVWGISSALAVVTIGFLSLKGGKARVRGATAFAAFSVSWGMQVALGNSVIFALGTEVEWWLRVFSLVLHLPVAYFLFEFAASQARGMAATLLRSVGVGFAVAAMTVFAFLPELVYPRPPASAQYTPFEFGPLHFPLVIVPYFLGFAGALLVLHHAHKTSPTVRTASRTSTLLTGIGVYTSFAAANNATFFSAATVLYPAPLNVPYAILFIFLAAVVAVVVVSNLRDALRGKDRDTRRRHLLVAGVLTASASWGMAEGSLALTVLPLLDTVGLWRLLGVGIIAYGLARWRLFDLPQRTAKTAATAAGASGSLVTGVATYGLATLVTTSALVPAFLGLAVVGASFIPGIRIARKLFSRFTNEDGASDDVVYGQRVEAYRAALEASLARGNPEEDTEFLAALRERFGISEAEDRLLRYYARSAVLVPKHGDGGAAYERLRLLGEGGAGRTWLARDRVRDRLVVLKEPLGRWQREDAVREMVLREARLAAKVRHANVIAVEEVVEDRGLPVIVMEHVEGGSLADLLRERGVLPWREAVELTVQVLRGVEAVHQSGIIHRDLKPSNVLLGADGTPKVADFGIATAIAPGGEGKTVVEGSTTFQGTIAYVAPEVRSGAAGDRRSDVYACGALLHECLRGSPPGPGMPVLASNEVPPRVASAMARAIHPDASQRFPTARAFADELVAVMRP